MAKNGKGAAEKAEQSDPDPMILDSGMLKMETLERLSEVLRNHRKRPPILVAGNSGCCQGPKMRTAYSRVVKLSNRIKLREGIEDLLITR